MVNNCKTGVMRIGSLLLFVLSAHLSLGQILTPTHWTVSPSKSEARAGEAIDLVLKATIDEGWYVYTVDFDPDCGPILMSVSLEKSTGFETVGPLKAINDETKHDKIFDCDVRIFKGNGEFRQRIKLLGGDVRISGTYEGQVCSDKEGKCIPFDGEFTADIKVAGSAKAGEKPKETESESTPVFQMDTSSTQIQPEPVESEAGPNKGPILDESILEGEPSYGQKSFGALLLVAFLAGFAALITPCVFPMVPMTVTFFLRDNQSRWEGIRKALIFGVSIIVIYTAAGTLFAILLGAEGLNALATHWAPNLFVFVIFIVFAL